MSNEFKHFYEFGIFRFDAARRVLWRGNETVALPPKATDVLACLLEEHGELVDREELLRFVWQDTFVEEGNLNHAISVLRKALGTGAIIQTVARRGYRFTADVTESGNDSDTGILVARQTITETFVDEHEEFSDGYSAAEPKPLLSSGLRRRWVPAAAVLFVIAGAGLVWYLYSRAGASSAVATSSTKTLVILPFRSLNEREVDKTLALGITENLAARLGSLDQLIVRPMSSAGRLAETESDPLVIGRKLGSDAVIDGSYQIVEGRIRVVVRLLDVADGSQIWTGTFEEAEGDIFKLQDSLSAQAARQLTDRLTRQQQQLLAAHATENVEAYKYYVRGRHAWNKRTADSLLESVRFFQSAVDADPTFALAYSGMADSYVVMNDYDAAPPNECYPKAKAAALRALEIQPDLVRPRVTLAYVLATYDWNFRQAEGEYRRALEMDPNYATAHQWYGEMLVSIKRFPEGEIELTKAGELDPLSPIIQSEIAVNLYYSGKYDEMIAHYAKLKQEYPAFPTSYLFSAWAYEQKGLYDQAFAEEIQYWQLQKVADTDLKELESRYKQGGRMEFLKYLASVFERSANDQYFHEYRLINIYGRLRDREKILEWLEKGIEKRSSNVVKVFIDPNFVFMRDDPRYQAALSKMNLL